MWAGVISDVSPGRMTWQPYFPKYLKFWNFYGVFRIQIKIKEHECGDMTVHYSELRSDIDSVCMRVARHGRTFKTRIKRGAICRFVKAIVTASLNHCQSSSDYCFVARESNK